jgi:hypothetical protein
MRAYWKARKAAEGEKKGTKGKHARPAKATVGAAEAT